MSALRFGLALLLCASTAAHAATVALVAPAELAALSQCVADTLRPRGAVVAPAALEEGIEVRFVPQHHGRRIELVAAVALIKTGAGPEHAAPDEEADDQAEAQRRIQALYRIHVGTRAWPWRGNPRGGVCSAAAAWIDRLRSHAVPLDHLGPDGEPPAPR